MSSASEVYLHKETKPLIELLAVQTKTCVISASSTHRKKFLTPYLQKTQKRSVQQEYKHVF